MDHATVNRWFIKYSLQLEEAFHRRKRPVCMRWRMDETYIRVKGPGVLPLSGGAVIRSLEMAETPGMRGKEGRCL